MAQKESPALLGALPMMNATPAALRGRHGLRARRMRFNAPRSKRAILGATLLSVIVVLAVIAPLTAQDPNAMQTSNRFAAPSRAHPFGTDQFGRDMWARVMFGARYSLQIGAYAVLLALAVGVPVGVGVALLGGWVDRIAMRAIDAVIAFPSIMFALFLQTVLGPAMVNLVIAIAFTYAPVFARTARGSVLQEKAKPYIEAARAVGADSLRIACRHVLPNITAPLLILTTFFFASALITESSLSFLGIGVQAFVPSWGAILNDGQRFWHSHPHILFFPGAMIILSVLGMNLLGEGLRDLLDPTQRRGTVDWRSDR